MRLYVLPRTQSVPPYNPPKDILDKTTIFECLGPEEAKIINLEVQRASGAEEPFDDLVVVNRCWKGKCNGRWKPARTRHCSDCGVCRAGFDHHCAFVSHKQALALTLVRELLDHTVHADFPLDASARPHCPQRMLSAYL